MWSEYTRETPARPGLGVTTAALALIGTTLMAWTVTQRDVAMQVEALPNWPITFSVPEGFIRRELSGDALAAEGLSAKTTYVLGTVRAVEAVLEVSYEVLVDDDPTLEELLADRGADAETTEVMLGTLKGRRFEKLDRRKPTVTLIAVGKTREGLVIELRYMGAASDPRGVTRFERICESIQFTKWSAPRPPAVETSRRPRR